jgi:hypothetical protein
MDPRVFGKEIKTYRFDARSIGGAGAAGCDRDVLTDTVMALDMEDEFVAHRLIASEVTHTSCSGPSGPSEKENNCLSEGA